MQHFQNFPSSGPEENSEWNFEFFGPGDCICVLLVQFQVEMKIFFIWKMLHRVIIPADRDACLWSGFWVFIMHTTRPSVMFDVL